MCGGRVYGVIAELRLCFRHWSEAADGWSQERVEAMEADGWWKWQIRKVYLVGSISMRKCEVCGVAAVYKRSPMSLCFLHWAHTQMKFCAETVQTLLRDEWTYDTLAKAFDRTPSQIKSMSFYKIKEPKDWVEVMREREARRIRKLEKK